MNVAIYTRTAVPSLAAHRWQRTRCVQFADQLGLDATHEYHDDGTSHPMLDLLVPELRAEGISPALIVESIDRLGRSTTDTDRVRAALSETGVAVYAADLATSEACRSPCE